MISIDDKKTGILKKILFFLKLLEIRLRFVIILLITALVIGYWDYIENYYERWQREKTMPEKTTIDTSKLEPVIQEYEYFCPMHVFVIRVHPDKCPICGMDLVKRKKGITDEMPKGVITRVQISPDRIMQAGVDIVPVQYRLLSRTIKSYGIIDYDETKVKSIIARFPGRVEKIFVDAVGLIVKKGDPLVTVYSPKFLASIEEYIQAIKSQKRIFSDTQYNSDDKNRAEQLTEYAKKRLILAGFIEEQLIRIAEEQKADDYITLYSPLSGTILKKEVLEGDMLDEGKNIYIIADLSVLWVRIQIIESELKGIKEGMPVEISCISYPGEIFYGNIDFIYPTLNIYSRTVDVRVIVDNSLGKLKPGMSTDAIIRFPVGEYHKFDKQEKKTDTKKKNADDIYTCPMHPEVISKVPADCPKCGMNLVKKELEIDANNTNDNNVLDEEKWAVGYACEMHINDLDEDPGICTQCGCKMEKTKWEIQKVLSIPETAVIDTGSRKIVYKEKEKGIYDSYEVILDIRTDNYYHVLEGLHNGDNIVAKGSFLIDAEARLNPISIGQIKNAKNTSEKNSAIMQHNH